MTRIKKLLIPFFKYLLFQVRVEGESMWPDLVPGKYYLASSLLAPKTGNFIVFPDPSDSKKSYVKRVAFVHKDGYEVEGNVSWASSSKNFGLIPGGSVLGTLIHSATYPSTKFGGGK